jgi:hypothetical protein
VAYLVSQRKRKLVEEIFGWMKTVGGSAARASKACSKRGWPERSSPPSTRCFVSAYSRPALPGSVLAPPLGATNRTRGER